MGAPSNQLAKINTDGAGLQRLGAAAAGRILWDSSGACFGGFMFIIGSCSVIHAELWGMLQGLQLAWEKGARFAVVESDSSTVVTLVNSCKSPPTVPSCLVQSIRRMCTQDWVIRITHVFWEANQVADWLANKALELDNAVHLFTDFPPWCFSLLGDISVVFSCLCPGWPLDYVLLKPKKLTLAITMNANLLFVSLL